MLKPTTVSHAAVIKKFLVAAYEGDMDSLRTLLDPRTVNMPHPDTGMTALHIAVGRNDLETVMALVEAGAAFVPDNEGRMPSVIAAEMEVDEELADYICEAESRALQAEGQEDV